MKFKTALLSIILPLIVGAAGGFMYYHFVGCSSGTCPITSNPYVSTSYGAAFGLALGIGFIRNRKK